MARKDLAGRKIKEIEEMSRLWDAEDLIRNFDEEMAKLEHGLGHMIIDLHENIVTQWLRPLPVTPRFDIEENEKELKLTVKLPNISKDKVRVSIDNNRVEIFACTEDVVCRPHFIAIDARGTLNPESAKAKMQGEVFEIKIAKARKKRLEVK
jgi:HSP20 family molecular chaperone IbpA